MLPVTAIINSNCWRSMPHARLRTGLSSLASQPPCARRVLHAAAIFAAAEYYECKLFDDARPRFPILYRPSIAGTRVVAVVNDIPDADAAPGRCYDGLRCTGERTMHYAIAMAPRDYRSIFAHRHYLLRRWQNTTLMEPPYTTYIEKKTHTIMPIIDAER